VLTMPVPIQVRKGSEQALDVALPPAIRRCPDLAARRPHATAAGRGHRVSGLCGKEGERGGYGNRNASLAGQACEGSCPRYC